MRNLRHCRRTLTMRGFLKSSCSAASTARCLTSRTGSICRWKKRLHDFRTHAASSGSRNRESALPQKRDQHRYAPTIWSVSIGAKFGGQKTFFHARLLPEPEDDQQGSEQSRDRPDRDAGCQHGCNKPGIDRMANETVWTCIDDPVAFLPCDRVRPEPSEVDSRPPGEQDAHQGQPRKKVCYPVAEIPERFLSEYL